MISEFFVDRPKFALVVSIVITLVGALAIYFIPVAEYPDITPPQVQVRAVYPGANAELIENTVAIPIEEQVNGVDGMIYMSSTSSNNGVYVLNVSFAIGTDPDIAAVNVQNRVTIAQTQLPQAVIQQGITTRKQSSAMLLVVNLVSPDRSRDEVFLSNYATNTLQDALARIPGVGDVSQFGPLLYSMRVWIDPNKLSALGLTATDIANAISSQNVAATTGQLGAAPFAGTTEFKFTLSAKGQLQSVEDFANIVVKSNTDGSILRLGDVARLELGSQSYTTNTTLNNRPAAAVAVYQAPDANALEVADGIYAQMEELKKSLPKGVEYRILYDVTKAVRASVDEIIRTLFITGFLVVAVTFVFLGSWRSTLIPAIAIPVSLIGAVAVLYMVGFTANMITLFAIILAITLVVDDSIVIVENTERLMEEEGLEPREATLAAMSQVTKPIIATTFVLLAVFVPVCFFPGVTGMVYLQFALTIITAFILSAINALTLGPVLCANLLKRGAAMHSGPLLYFERVVEKTRDHYVRYVGLLCKNPMASMAVVALFAVAIAFFVKTTPTGFVPLEDKGALMVNVQLQPGASLQRTNQVMDGLSKKLNTVDGISDVIGVSGYSMLAGAGSNYGLFIAILDPWSDRKSSELQWYNILSKMDDVLGEEPAADSFAFPLPPINGLGLSGGVNAQLQDYKNASMQDLAAAARAIVIQGNSDPLFKRMFTTISASNPGFFIDIDRDRAEALGVPISEIFASLQAMIGTYYVNTFVFDSRLYWVVLSAEAEFRQTPEDIGRLQVRNNSGDMVPLQALVTINPQLSSESIDRYNLFRTAAINGMTVPGRSTGEAIEAIETMASKALPEGYGIAWTGMSYQEVKAGQLMVYVFFAAFLFAYFFLVAQYESWSLPLAVMISAFFAVFGAFLPLWAISVLDNNIYAQIGVVLLIGLAAKKAIMLVAFSVSRREAGESVYEAAISSARTRFRPVTMTGLCFIIGVIPMVLASGAGASSRISLGVVVFSGMILDSVVGLLFIPVLYYVFESMRERFAITALMPQKRARKTAKAKSK